MLTQIHSIKGAATSHRVTYGTHTFRSRMEAKWAAFLNGYAIQYEYEAYLLENVGEKGYLPDFFFPQIMMYGEAKQFFYPNEIEKCRQVAVQTGCGVLLLEGLPSVECYWGFPHYTTDTESKPEDLLVPYVFGNDKVYRLGKEDWVGRRYHVPVDDKPKNIIYLRSDLFTRLCRGVDDARDSHFEREEVEKKDIPIEPVVNDL